MTDNIKLREELLVSRLSSVKIPKAFRKQFTGWKDQNPTAEMREDENKVYLTYVWEK